MATISHDNLLVCSDCASLIANAEGTPEHATKVGARWPNDDLVLSGGEDEEAHFSTQPCDGCGDHLHGDRINAVAFVRHARYLVVGGRADLRTLEAYLYSQDTVLSHAVGNDRIVAVVRVTGVDEENVAFRGNYVAGRLSSGLYGVEVFTSLDEANAESVVKRALLGV